MNETYQSNITAISHKRSLPTYALFTRDLSSGFREVYFFSLPGPIRPRPNVSIFMA